MSQFAISKTKRLTRIYKRRDLLNELSKEVKAIMEDVILTSKCLQCLKRGFGDDGTTSPGDIVS